MFSGSERNRNIVREHRFRNNVVVLNIGASGDLCSSGLDEFFVSFKVNGVYIGSHFSLDNVKVLVYNIIYTGS